MQHTALPEYHAVLHVLTAPLIAERTATFIGPEDFDFAGLESATGTMSGGEKLLVAIASDMWHATRTTGVWELARKLDRENFERVLEALRLARGASAWGMAAGRLGTHEEGAGTREELAA
jgi:hypothetical protein